MPTNKYLYPDSNAPGHVASTDQLGLVQWMPLTEAKRLALLWTTGCDFDNQPQWRAAMRVLLDDSARLRLALTRITHFTSATPSLSESGCGRLLAQIEHEATRALEA